MARVAIEFVALGANDNAPLGSKVYIPARIDRDLRGTTVQHYRLRVLTIVNRQQQVPVNIREWMQGDSRYKNWFNAEPVLEAVALETLETEDEDTIGGEVLELPPVPEGLILEPPPPPMDDEDEDEGEETQHPLFDLFDSWGPDEIEEANLTGEDGLLAYAAYKEIDLGDARLKSEVLATILEWYDASLD